MDPLAELKERLARDEYLLWERSPETLAELRSFLDKPGPDRAAGDRALALLARGLGRPASPEGRQAAARAVWGRLRPKAEAAHAAQAEELLGRLGQDPWAIVYLKKLFKVLAKKQGLAELAGSSYLEE